LLTVYASSYAYPTYYAGPVLTTLPYTTINSTHWRWVFRCQNCVGKLSGRYMNVGHRSDRFPLAWTNSVGGGSLNQAGSGAIGYVSSEVAVDTPSNPNSTFAEHSYDSITGLDLSGAHNANYQTYLSGGGKSTTSTTSTKTTTTTSSKPTTTTTTTKTTTTTTKTTTASPTPTGTVPKYGQCGGTGVRLKTSRVTVYMLKLSQWTGATTCVAGSTCVSENPYYVSASCVKLDIL
jgi:hypothetical protein